MDNQEAFNSVYAWISREGATKCMVDGTCLYRDNGNRCAIGALMTDELFLVEVWDSEKDKMVTVGEFNGPISDLVNESDEVDSYFFDMDFRLLNDLQAAHDVVAEGEEWQGLVIKELLTVAEKFELEIPA